MNIAGNIVEVETMRLNKDPHIEFSRSCDLLGCPFIMHSKSEVFNVFLLCCFPCGASAGRLDLYRSGHVVRSIAEFTLTQIRTRLSKRLVVRIGGHSGLNLWRWRGENLERAIAHGPDLVAMAGGDDLFLNALHALLLPLFTSISL